MRREQGFTTHWKQVYRESRSELDAFSPGTQGHQLFELPSIVGSIPGLLAILVRAENSADYTNVGVYLWYVSQAP